MKSTLLLMTAVLTSQTLWAAQSIYCPQNHRYINVGMTEAQVMAACGQPLSKNTSSQSVEKRVPVKQLIYKTLNRSTSFYPTLDPIYQAWSIPTGVSGVNVKINVINQKVTSININGAGTKTMTFCDNNNIQVGSSESAVYSACGAPDFVNQTYTTQSVSQNAQPQVWLYQIDPYQPPMSLTFVNGTLQSIN